MVVWLHLFSHWSVYRPSIYSCAVHFCLYCCPIISVRFVKKTVDGGRRENRGAEVPRRVGYGEVVFPFPPGSSALPRKFLIFFISK